MGELFTINLLCILIAYLLGSISFSYIISRKVAGIDIREHGSKNAGATNTFRVLGKGPAGLVLLLDALKGSVSVLLAIQLTSSAWVIVLAGLFAIIGHNWPLFYGFKGGKGVATAIGVMFTLAPIPFILTSVVGLVFLYMFRYVSLSSLVGATILPFIMMLNGYEVPYLTGAFIILILAYTRHRSNIVRLWQGTESRLGKGSRDQ
jgi:glycerol-3-phosphate acyltransferase PlsY